LKKGKEMSRKGYEEALRRIEEVKQNGEDSLDLSHLDLEEIPREVSELSGLTML